MFFWRFRNRVLEALSNIMNIINVLDYRISRLDSSLLRISFTDGEVNLGTWTTMVAPNRMDLVYLKDPSTGEPKPYLVTQFNRVDANSATAVVDKISD